MSFAAIAIISCDREGASASPASEDVQPEQVDPEALKAAAEDDQVKRFYEAAQWQAVWDKARAAELMEALHQAQAHGLSTESFVDSELPRDPSEREAALTKAALEYASALADGFTDPGKIRDIYTVPRPKTDVVAGLAQAISGGQVEQWLASLAPQTNEYRALSTEFIRYARQAKGGDAAAIAAGDSIEPGDSDPRVPRIVEALAANGYLDPRQAQQPAPQAYTAPIAQAVQRMQQDYGIDADGIVGSDTLRVLNTGAADRARQLAVNLERLRWLDRSPPATRIDVNTAAALLDYWRDGRHVDQRRVVVGEPGWETPQLGSPIVQLVANPNWVVPESIYEEELADKGPAYFRQNNMVRRNGRVVQLPGPESALGLVKFNMENPHAIYLHDTPAKGLFSQNERHRSHGCVRVHNAVQFAHMIAQQDGILPKFQKAMATQDETPVKLNSQIPVRLMYHSAFVDRTGQVQYRADAYGWDEDVARALGREARESRTVRAHERGGDIGP